MSKIIYGENYSFTVEVDKEEETVSIAQEDIDDKYHVIISINQIDNMISFLEDIKRKYSPLLADSARQRVLYGQ